MRQFYMDTNVFISRWKPDDPYYEEAKIIATSLQKGDITAETSVLTLLETASVAGRMHRDKMRDKGGSEERRLFVIRTLQRLVSMRIRFIHVEGDIPVPFRNERIFMPSLLAESIFLSFSSTLRTLDLVHMAAAKHVKETAGKELGAFVTGDHELLLKKDEISQVMRMPILSPKEYVQALGLKL